METEPEDEDYGQGRNKRKATSNAIGFAAAFFAGIALVIVFALYKSIYMLVDVFG